MKKALFMFIAAAFVVAFAACENKKAAPAEGEGSTEVVAEEAQVEESMSLADIVAKAKAEGANWSVDEWKDVIKQAFLAYKPMAVATHEIMKKIEEGKAADLDIDAEGKKIDEQFPDFDKLMRELSEVASQTANGKTVTEDTEWIDKTREELGVPKD